MADFIAQKFDGMSVDVYSGKFSGGFDIDAADAVEQRIDSDVFFVVRAKVRGATFNETKTGDLQRTNVYTVAETIRVPNDVGFRLQTALSAQMSLQFSDGGLLDDLEMDPDD